jgi:hypothetical protein
VRGKKRKPRSHLCRWCGKDTGNHSGICDKCWSDAEILRANSDEGFKAWLERKRAMEGSRVKRVMSEGQRRALSAARVAKFSVQMLQAGPKVTDQG